MKTLLVAALAALCLSSCALSGRKHAVNLYGGMRSFGNSDFEDTEDQPVYGIDGLLGLTTWGLGIEGGYLHSEEDGDIGGLNTDVETDEFYLGLRETFLSHFFLQPYVAAGVSSIEADADASGGLQDDDSSIAGYARVGLGLQFSIFQFGLDGRGLFGSDLDIGGSSTDADYFQVTGFIGLTF